MQPEKSTQNKHSETVTVTTSEYENVTKLKSLVTYVVIIPSNLFKMNVEELSTAMIKMILWFFLYCVSSLPCLLSVTLLYSAEN